MVSTSGFVLWPQSTSGSTRDKTSVPTSPHDSDTLPSRAGECAHTRQRSLELHGGSGGRESPGWPRDTRPPQALLTHLSCGLAGGQCWASPGALAGGPVGFSLPRVLPAPGPAGGRWRWRLGTGGQAVHSHVQPPEWPELQAEWTMAGTV